MPKKVLTHKRAKWAKSRKAIIRGKPLRPNVGVQDNYQKRLDSLIRTMRKTVEKEIGALFDTAHAKKFFAMDANISPQANLLMNSLMKRFQQLFDTKAQGLASRMVDENDRASSGALHGSLKELSGGLSLKTTSITPAMKQIMKASIAENVGLIKSIPSQYLTQVQGAVMRSITTGNGMQDLFPALNKYGEITERRARLIARDQTRKVYNNLNAGRMKAVGVQKYEWCHSNGDREPRPLHLNVLNGQIFSLDNPPVIDEKTGQRGKPGDLINCTCFMRPIVDFSGLSGDDGGEE